MAKHTYHPVLGYNAPPKPVVEAKISTDLAELLGPSLPVKVNMLIDTGADISCVPRQVITQLEKALDTKFPYYPKEVEDFLGKKFIQWIYELKMDIEINFRDQRTMFFLAIDGDEGILGRDVLNDHLICLDGPAEMWVG